MIPWEHRPIEVANLFNPAFCGEVIRRCGAGYSAKLQTGMPYALAFLVLPIVLHPATRWSEPLDRTMRQRQLSRTDAVH